MPKYEYEAVNPTNRTRHRGVIDAPSMELALQRLMARKIFPSYFAELSSSQVNVANRIANYKKITRVNAPEEIEPPVSIPKTVKLDIDWTYVILGAIAIVLVLWALGR